MRYLLHRDTILSTFFVFITAALLYYFPLNLKILNPIKLALSDFEILDISFSKLGNSNANPVDSNIIIVNTGKMDRKEIAYLIDQIGTFHPKVIGLDLYFPEPRDSAGDNLLANAINKQENIVLASILELNEKSVSERKSIFANTNSPNGYTNFIGKEKGTIRSFSPFEIAGKDSFASFSSRVVAMFDSGRYRDLVKRHREVERINFRRRTSQYFIIDGEQLFQTDSLHHLFPGKLVLVGVVGPPYDIEDKYFTPLNEKFAGKSTPDMNGVVIHANIISMILENAYPRQVPSWLKWFLFVIITWLHVAFYVRYFVEDHLWYHLAAKISQLVSAVILVYLSLLLFVSFNIQLNMFQLLSFILLSVDVLYFYEALAIWLNKKFGYRTIFINGHHEVPAKGHKKDPRATR